MNPLLFFTDPILRGPTLGSMWMALAASQVGVIALLRRRSLVGESLSHATYPGVLIGAIVAAALGVAAIPVALLGALFTALLGIWVVHQLEHRLKVSQDAALCLVLSTFFGVGLTLASRIQFTHTLVYKQVLTLLYGQAATMTDPAVWASFALAALICAVIALFYKEVRLVCFDRSFSTVLGFPVGWIEGILFGLTALSVVVGLRSIGVVLMSAMLIAPPIAARQFSNRFGLVLLISALVALGSGFFGNYLSVVLPIWFSEKLSLPTGPMIVLVAALFCIGALLFAPGRGAFWCAGRALRFRNRCLEENTLKALWRFGEGAEVDLSQLGHPIALRRLTRSGWLVRKGKRCSLTEKGYQRASHIIRLHRLWELYLVNCLGVGVDRVHRSAEEMEHILTPELESELTSLLHNPERDPHAQPIPKGEKQ